MRVLLFIAWAGVLLAQAPAPTPFATSGSGGGGAGTVESVTINGTANQITATGTCTITTTGTCTLSLPSNVVLPGTINSLTLTTSTGTFTLTNAKTFTVNNTLTIQATDGTTIVFPDPASVTNGNCMEWTKSGTTLTLTDAGAACGSAGVAPYSTTTIGASPFSIPESTHGQGVYAFVMCWDSDMDPQALVACDVDRDPATGDLTITYTTAPGQIDVFGGGGGGGGGSSAFSDLTSGTNTGAAMVVGTGASLGVSGSGTIAATAVPVGGITGLGTGVGTWLATPSGANLASALTTALPNTKGGTGGDSSAQTGVAKVASGTWSYASIVNADIDASAAIVLSKLATQSDQTILANISGGAAVPSASTLTAILDDILGTTQGSVLYRNATVWTTLGPGTNGQFLQTQGAAANIQWATAGGAITGLTTGTYTRAASATTIEDGLIEDDGTDVTVNGGLIVDGDISSTCSGSCPWEINVNASLATSTGSGIMLPGSSLTAGTLYYQASGGLTQADADADTSVPAVCLAVSTTRCLTNGVYRFSASQGWTAGEIVYVSTTAGALTTTAPSGTGDQVQRVGVALANDTILVMPSLDVAEIL